uniref:Uncharacterized protein n=1 Tax=Globodera pallida TaxID=36090 RepID=A0A183BUJ2_GLOPA
MQNFTHTTEKKGKEEEVNVGGQAEQQQQTGQQRHKAEQNGGTADDLALPRGKKCPGKQQQHQRQLKKQLITVHPNRSFPNVAGFDTLADTSSDDCLPFNFKNNLRPARISTMVTDVHNVNDESPLDFSKSGQQQHKTAATMGPKSVIISTTHNAQANLNLAPSDSVVGELFIKADCQTQQKKQPPPSSDCSTSAVGDRWTPVVLCDQIMINEMICCAEMF